MLFLKVLGLQFLGEIYILFLICKVFIVNYNTVDLITCEVIDCLRVMKIN